MGHLVWTISVKHLSENSTWKPEDFWCLMTCLALISQPRCRIKISKTQDRRMCLRSDSVKEHLHNLLQSRLSQLSHLNVGVQVLAGLFAGQRCDGYCWAGKWQDTRVSPPHPSPPRGAGSGPGNQALWTHRLDSCAHQRAGFADRTELPVLPQDLRPESPGPDWRRW